MPIQITKKYKEGTATVIEGTAQLVDDTASLDGPVVLKECTWKASLEAGQALWKIDVLSGDDLRGSMQAKLQSRTKQQ